MCGWDGVSVMHDHVPLQLCPSQRQLPPQATGGLSNARHDWRTLPAYTLSENNNNRASLSVREEYQAMRTYIEEAQQRVMRGRAAVTSN